MDYELRIKDLDKRILSLNQKIHELEEVKLSWMIMRRELNQEMCKKTLEDCFTDELKDLLQKHIDSLENSEL